MQSSRRASLLRRSASAGILFVLVASRAPADPASPDSSAEPGTPANADALDEPPGVERVIVLARTPGDEGAILHLRAELGESDWRVLEVPFDERDARSLGRIAERERASAVVRMDARRGVIELWVRRPEGAVEEALDASGEARSESVLALRVVEALRARGLRIERAHAEPPPALEAPPPVVAPAPAKVAPAPPVPEARGDAARLWLALGPGLLVSPGGLDPELVIEADVRIEFAARWSLGASGLVPLATRSLSGPEGEALVATWLAGGVLELEWARLPFGGVRSGLGAGVSVTSMSGDAEQGFEGANDTVTSFAPQARSSFHVDLGESFELCAGVALGVTIPEVKVAFGERTAASWGRPFFLASIALETSPLSF
jgi:hypothetical protein